MANIYKSNYTGQQIDNSINKIINIIPQEKLTPGGHISIKDNVIDITEIDGLAGGTLTSPLIITGGDQSSASKIVLDPANKGQITDNSTSTLFGFISSGNLTISSNTYNTIIRGGNDSSIGGKLFSSLAQNSDIKNGILTIKLGADGTTTVKDTFSANQETDSTITLPVYSKEEINEMITGAVQYLGSIINADALIKKTPNSIGDFCRATQDFQLPAANSITAISVNVHTSDILICELLNNSGNKWSVVHGENWQGNTKTTDGYVTAGGSNFNKVWKTDGNGVPGWRDDANTDTGITSIEVTGNGNAITSARISERKMTLNKDTTFITSLELPAVVSANPTLSGSETELTGLQIGSTKYKIPNGGSGDVTAAGNNTFTGTNTFTSGNIVVSKTDSSNKTMKVIYGSNAISYTPYGETMAKLISLPAKDGTLALTSDIPDTSDFVKLSDDNTFTGYNSFSHRVAVTDGSSPSDNLACLDYNCITRTVGISHYTLTFPSKSGTIALTSDIPRKYLHHLYITGRDEEGVNFVICAMHISNSETTISTFAQLLSEVAARRMMATGYCGTRNSLQPVYCLEKAPASNNISINTFMTSQGSGYDIGPDAIPDGGIIDSVFII